MVVDQQSLLEDKDRLEELRRSYDGEARLNESFIVLTVGASQIASLTASIERSRRKVIWLMRGACRKGRAAR